MAETQTHDGTHDAHQDHHEVVPNPDYDGPQQHCLPPDVEETPVLGIGFVVLMIGIALGAAYMGIQLLK